MKRFSHRAEYSAPPEPVGRVRKFGSWVIVMSLAAGAWVSLPDSHHAGLTAADTASLSAAKDEAGTAAESANAPGFLDSFDAAAKAPTHDSPFPDLDARRLQHSVADPDANLVADNDSTPDDEVNIAAPQSIIDIESAAADDSRPSQAVLNRAIARLDTAPPSQQRELVEKIWGLGLDLGQEQIALTAIEALTFSHDPSLAERAREAIESLTAALAAATVPSIPTADLAAETDAYVMELKTRATSDPDALVRQTAITELASHAHPGAVDALATAALDPETPNRAQVVSSLMRLADAGYQQERIVALLEVMALQDTVEVATSAKNALKSLR